MEPLNLLSMAAYQRRKLNRGWKTGQRLARRLRRANRLRHAPRNDLKLALVLFCFPPNKGNIGTAADLDVFPSVWDTLKKLKADGYDVELPTSPAALRERLLGGNSETFGATANVAYRMDPDEYRRLCPYLMRLNSSGEGASRINSFGNDLLIQGLAGQRIYWSSRRLVTKATDAVDDGCGGAPITDSWLLYLSPACLMRML